MRTLYEWAGGEEAFARLIEAFYLEWGTRRALRDSQPDAEVAPHAPVPRWGWGEGPPSVP